MAGFALVAESIGVNIVDNVASGATLWRVFVLSLQVTGIAANLPMRKFQPEAGFIVIEFGFAPARGDMAGLAFFAELAAMRIVGGMTVVTGVFCLPVFLLLPVAVAACGQAVFSG